MAKSLQDRVKILEDAVGSALGISLSHFDPEHHAAIEKANKAKADKKAKAEQAVRDKEEARVAAEREAAAKAQAAIDARAEKILDEKNKKA